MFRATRVLGMAVQKTTTGLVGLKVNPNWRSDLIHLYGETLKATATHLPECHYRTSVEQITNFRLKVVTDNTDENIVEKTVNCGQVEELIEQAEDELFLIPKYAEWRLWEPPVAPKDQ
ncbi:hypothetical protein SDRG_10276 [Saprolegnia diclina VS20]|uniref:NADH dehydrogenase (Ubiquinone) 1 alpha subcomplex 5 n=1 Tax=Saprolegnia diclina (strain VS20) TaxID=1156394 RepID=T0Q2L8_SAPDV|nr:hypothetical protein SDRG_10276 [Saprolegnia diclina VS20]EQC32079.1 hypothetical protein SDRG_10276 [Saprolegnia diclina VS20]|eukprot:XP_008614481.1 hypothetical protein SDRG_10276 [Saprolegnia diclina VS20]